MQELNVFLQFCNISSVKPVDKRDGSGSYNWGTPQDELAARYDFHNFKQADFNCLLFGQRAITFNPFINI